MLNSSRVIDCVTHNLTSTQAMFRLMDMFEIERVTPIVLVTPVEMGKEFQAQIRAAISRHRKRNAESGGRAVMFGFLASGPYPYSHPYQKVEAMLLEFQITPRQAMINWGRSVSLELNL